MMHSTTRAGTATLEQPRYWLRENGQEWRQVSMQEFVSGEQRAGHRYNPDGRPATAGFSWRSGRGESIEGRLDYGNERPTN